MKKGLLLILLLFLSVALTSEAIVITASDNVNAARTGINYNSIPYGNYLKYYIIDINILTLVLYFLYDENQNL